MSTYAKDISIIYIYIYLLGMNSFIIDSVLYLIIRLELAIHENNYINYNNYGNICNLINIPGIIILLSVLIGNLPYLQPQH